MLASSSFDGDDSYQQLDLSEPLDEKPQNSDLLCIVCGDLATGRHYGAIACNGCKGFFRRTIRRGYKYTCRFNSNCNIDKHNRAVCRYCRYTRCINSGMKVEAVQNERDVIGKRPRTGSQSTVSSTTGNRSTPSVNSKRPSMDEPSSSKRSSPELNDGAQNWDNPRYLLDSLLHSEKTIQNLRDTVIKQTGTAQYTTKTEFAIPPPLGAERTATVNDIFKSLHSQLLLVIEWAKTLPPFAQLTTEDQTALLKNFAAQHVVLCVAYRSIDTADFLKLINDSCIPRSKQYVLNYSDFYVRDCERVMDQLVAPMRFLKVDDIEFAAMKACVLFNPVAKSLTTNSVHAVLDTRRKIFAALEAYIKRKSPDDTNRVGDLTFFILSPLQSIANTLSEDVLVTKLSGVAKIDVLMEELILSETEESKCTPSRSPDSIPIRDPTPIAPPVPPTSSSMLGPMSVIAGAPNPFRMSAPTLATTTTTTHPAPPTDPLSDEFENFQNYPATTLSSYVLGPLDDARCESPDLISPTLSVGPPMWNSSPINSCESNSLFLPTCTDFP